MTTAGEAHDSRNSNLHHSDDAAKTASGPIKRVVIVGGGTAGWLSACHLARHLSRDLGNKQPAGRGGVQVTLIESADIPTIGVGEGTVPAIRQSLAYLGIRESDFIRECDVTLKQSIKFVDWLTAPKPGNASHSYHHVFDYPAGGDFYPTPYWLMGKAGDKSYVDAVSVQGLICDKGLGPKRMTDIEYDGLVNYAYHLDAAKFAAFLTRHATKNLGVVHKTCNVTDVKLSANGMIAGVETDNHGLVEGDLFLDCTGFRALMIEKKLNVPFLPKDDILFVDTALAVQVPYSEPNAPIPSYTISTAREAGWIWDIGLSERRGTGYVYSSKYSSDAAAETVLRDYLRTSLGAKADALDLRRIPMRIGYRDRAWAGNCIAIGLSQGFVEPLEATGILMYDATARMLAEQFPPNFEAMPGIAKRFNERVTYAWDRVIDFIKLHYVLSRRDDTAFWTDNRSAASTPASLRESLDQWRHLPPSDYDFASKLSIFNLQNYLYVLYGMGFETDMAPLGARYGDEAQARALFDAISREAQAMAGVLLPHRELIARIKQFGLQRV